jgi:hypothetical protein
MAANSFVVNNCSCRIQQLSQGLAEIAAPTGRGSFQMAHPEGGSGRARHQWAWRGRRTGGHRGGDRGRDLAGRRIERVPTREVARIIGMLPQSPVAPDDLTVADLVMRGRHPHQNWFRQWSAGDELVSRLHRERGRTIVMVLHDLNLAARYADHVVAMRDGRIVAQGRPAEVFTVELLESVFGLSALVVPDPATGTSLVVPLPRAPRPALEEV